MGDGGSRHLPRRKGTEPELQTFVRHPKSFIAKRETTAVVVMDQTALWVKLRGEESIYVSTAETTAASKRKVLAKRFKALDKADPEKVREFEEEAEKFCEAHADMKSQTDAVYSSAGDKYRLTLINMSAVENWFHPTESPTPVKKRTVLLVPSTVHCRLSDMDLEKATWLRNVTYECNDETTRSFKKGDPLDRLLIHWRNALLQLEPHERVEVLKHLDIWGQPRAWTDELIACWTVDFIEEQFGQSICFADCLSSQWTEKVCMRAWLRGPARRDELPRRARHSRARPDEGRDP